MSIFKPYNQSFGTMRFDVHSFESPIAKRSPSQSIERLTTFMNVNQWKENLLVLLIEEQILKTIMKYLII